MTSLSIVIRSIARRAFVCRPALLTLASLCLLASFTFFSRLSISELSTRISFSTVCLVLTGAGNPSSAKFTDLFCPLPFNRSHNPDPYVFTVDAASSSQPGFSTFAFTIGANRFTAFSSRRSPLTTAWTTERRSVVVPPASDSTVADTSSSFQSPSRSAANFARPSGGNRAASASARSIRAVQNDCTVFSSSLSAAWASSPSRKSPYPGSKSLSAILSSSSVKYIVEIARTARCMFSSSARLRSSSSRESACCGGVSSTFHRGEGMSCR
mmetsp:Transcript_5777/g.10396  ORF Transcript_5777/g.10396 Transcript_5777/m.10396 type:complete len:269 (-) Transcript_5777:528-1334(-)